jgi:hypothetical protein
MDHNPDDTGRAFSAPIAPESACASEIPAGNIDGFMDLLFITLIPIEYDRHGGA